MDFVDVTARHVSSADFLSCRYLNGLVKFGLNKLNYTYFIIDEPCFIGRAADGTLLENKTTWPTGLQAFGAELRSYGMKLGIYTCVGPKTCGGCVASEGHEDQDMQTFADWGAEYVKVDSCSRNCTVAAGVSGNTSTCGRELWGRYTSAIAKTGKDIVYSIIGNCDPARGEQPWKWGKEVKNFDIPEHFVFVFGGPSHACLSALHHTTRAV